MTFFAQSYIIFRYFIFPFFSAQACLPESLHQIGKGGLFDDAFDQGLVRLEI